MIVVGNECVSACACRVGTHDAVGAHDHTVFYLVARVCDERFTLMFVEEVVEFVYFIGVEWFSQDIVHIWNWDVEHSFANVVPQR